MLARRSWFLVLGLSVGLGAGVAILVWMTSLVLRLESEERKSRQLAAREENVRLALWRLDSNVAPLLAQEIARPYVEMQSFAPARSADGAVSETLLVPSPLLSVEVPFIRLHFEIDDAGELTSPQVPRDELRALALASVMNSERLATSADRIAQLERMITHSDALASVPPLDETTRVAAAVVKPLGNSTSLPPSSTAILSIVHGDRRNPTSDEPLLPQGELPVPQMARSATEFANRQQFVDNQVLQAVSQNIALNSGNVNVSNGNTTLRNNAVSGSLKKIGAEMFSSLSSFGSMPSVQSMLTLSGSEAALNDLLKPNPPLPWTSLTITSAPSFRSPKTGRPEMVDTALAKIEPFDRLSEPRIAFGYRPALALSAPIAKRLAVNTPPQGTSSFSLDNLLRRPMASIPSPSGLGLLPLDETLPPYRLSEATMVDVAPREVAPSVIVGPLFPLWVGDELLLARRLKVDNARLIQGCWVDWPALREHLRQTVHDLLPQSQLLPTRDTQAQPGGRLLATLPVTLEPGSPSAPSDDGARPLRLSLIVALLAAALAAAAVIGVVVWAVMLSERRIAFVSSVTHELRSPLTTFRLYCDMLADDMVTDPQRRREYLETLRSEASRLRHLMENVLFYARLERRGRRNTMESLSVGELLSRVGDRLTSRAQQGEMELAWDVAVDLRAGVRADVSAVEQILFNLVDNACKYASSASDRRIVVETREMPRSIEICVRDFGAGIARHQRKHLFRPFAHAGNEARRVPGVGLGLALSRRLALGMGGNLKLDAHNAAAFILELPCVALNSFAISAPVTMKDTGSC